LDLTLAGFPSKAVGIGGRLLLDYALDYVLPSDSEVPIARSPGLNTQVFVGPVFRVFDSAADGGRARSLRIHATFAVAHGGASPLVGNAKYVADLGFLDGGTYALQHFGGALRVSASFEFGPKAIFDWSIDGAFYAPATDTLITKTQEPASEVLQSPAPLAGSRLSVGGHLGVLFASEKVPLAFGPFLDLRLNQVGLTFPNAADDCWDDTADSSNPTAACLEGDENHRKVYSTLRADFFVRAGIQVRFGLSRKQSK